MVGSIGAMAERGNMQYEYQVINLSLEPSPDPHGRVTIEQVANRYAEKGWRTISVIPSRGPGYADSILIEREK